MALLPESPFNLLRYLGRLVLMAVTCIAIPNLPQIVRAETLPDPEGPVVLTVTGKIGNTNGASSARFDMHMLEALGPRRLTTWTPWTDGEHIFEGVSLTSLLQALNAEGDVARARALNDYVVDIALQDAVDDGALLAFKMDGQYMRIRNKGPLWLVFPWSDRPQLNRARHKRTSIWQLSEIHIR